MINFLLLLGVLSPGISLFHILFGFYLPNEKLSILFAATRTLMQGRINTVVLQRCAIFFIILSLIFLVRYIIFGIFPTVSDINLLVSYALLPLVAISIGNLSSFMLALKKYSFVAIAWGLAQQLLMSLGADSILYSMLTHPDKVSNYVFDSWAPYLYRVPGFQIESSQYACLLGFILFLIRTHREFYSKPLEVMLIFSIVINGATTGYLSLIMAYLLTTRFRGVMLIRFFLIMAVVSIAFFYVGLFDDQLQKLKLLWIILEGTEEVDLSYGRISGLISAINIFELYELPFGLGLEWRGGHDFFSVTIIGIGILGTLVMVYYIISFKSVFLTKTITFYAPYLLSAGSLLDPVYEVGLIYIIVVSLERGRVNNATNLLLRKK